MAREWQSIATDETQENLIARHGRHEFILGELVWYGRPPHGKAARIVELVERINHGGAYSHGYRVKVRASPRDYYALCFPEELRPRVGTS